MTNPASPFLERESRVLIPGPAGQLELLVYGAQTRGDVSEEDYLAIVCHPHPLHGGSMRNKVVTTLLRVYRDLGMNAVTFNFRGVGASEGSHDSAKGEVDDLLSVIAWAESQRPNAKLLLAGFSFGSAIAAAATYRLDGQTVNQLTLVAPPIERYAFDQDGHFPCPVVVVIGDKDELVDVPGVIQWQAGLKSHTRLLNYPEATHFFHGHLSELKSDLSQLLQQELSLDLSSR